MNLVQTTKYECFEPIFSSMELMINQIVDATTIRNSMNNPNSNLHQLSKELQKGLLVQFKSSWGFVIALFVSYFNRFNRDCADFIKLPIQSLSEFAKDPSARFYSITSQALSAAIKILGPQEFLNILPLHLNLPWDSKERREWLLPILQKSITTSTLEYFGKHFLPLLTHIKQQIVEAEKNDNFVEAKHHKVIYNQVWELLPGFCTFPLDVKENFKNLAKTIGTLLNNEPDLRIILCKSITTLITKNRSLLTSDNEFYLDNNEHDDGDYDDESFTGKNENTSFTHVQHELISPELAQENLDEIGKFAKNFFPILFNIFCSMDYKTKDLKLRSAIYNAIKAFASASDKPVSNLFL